MCRIRLFVRNRRLTITAITRFIRRSLLSATSRSGSVGGEQVNRKDQCVAALDLVVAFLTVRVFGRAYQDHATPDLLVDQQVVPALDQAPGTDRKRGRTVRPRIIEDNPIGIRLTHNMAYEGTPGIAVLYQT